MALLYHMVNKSKHKTSVMITQKQNYFLDKRAEATGLSEGAIIIPLISERMESDK